jgi:cobaltochelatase CobN
LHLLVRETQTLDEQESAVDLGQSPAELVFLSFSDSDLGALSTAWRAMPEPRPALRLASLAQLRHPMSVDLYVDQVVSGAKCVVVRLLGGLDYWRYGAEEFDAACRARGIALAMVPGDARNDPRLAELSTVEASKLARLDALLREGGPENTTAALLLGWHLSGGRPDDEAPVAEVSSAGLMTLPYDAADRPLAVIVFYRSHLLAGDFAPVEALAAALWERGLGVAAVYVSSLKEPAAAAFVGNLLRGRRPAVVLNATGFSARRQDGSPLDAAGAPVLQLIQAVGGIDAWQAGFSGLSQTDLAMQVVLPELDGRLLTAAISFKSAEPPDAALEFGRSFNRPDSAGIALAADRAAGWAGLARTPAGDRRIAVVLSDYPGAGGQIAHAVGLDSFASVATILGLLQRSGYSTEPRADLPALICDGPMTAFLDLPGYSRLFATLPVATQDRVIAAWGEPEADPAIAEGYFTLRHHRLGSVLLAVQPDRGNRLDRKASYHDAELPPRHGYIAFYLWLREIERIHAVVHLGTHGTLEWLPGKAVALSDACFPTALIRGLPVIYPFIVNNPGEAAAAKRRLGAVTIGHLTPPLSAAGLHGAAAELEKLIDEYAAADGLDRRRGTLLRTEILGRAEDLGLLAESGVRQDTPADEALARLDAYLCDVKDLQIRDGLHVFAAPPRQRDALLAALQLACPAVPSATLSGGLDACAEAEAAGLLAALDGRLVSPGPAGAPTRGRADVLPTGRNLFAIDPRAVPTRSAMVLAEKSAAELMRRHRQDHGDWLRNVVIDLWGSATMRTGGEDLALALVLIGARPLWDDGSNRVAGIEILPIALLDRPRVDVTLRISGLFRDAFPGQIALFDSAIRAVAARDEAADWNGLAAAARGLDGGALRQATTRIYGAAPGDYGSFVADVIGRGAWEGRAELGAAYLAGSSNAYGSGLEGNADQAGFAARVAGAEAFVHQQDHAETDLLESTEYAAHEGGFAAAAGLLGATPVLYHTDTSRPGAPRIRLLSEEVARVVRGRAANPAWIAGMLRHGYRGASEIARALDALHAFAATLPERFDPQFDLLFDATLGDPAVDSFLRDANPAARAAMAQQFQDALNRDLWRPRRNTVAAVLEAP